MRILVVDDSVANVEGWLKKLRNLGLNAAGIMPHESYKEFPTRNLLTEEDVLAMVRDADVIFLDHNMSPGKNGDDLIADWRRNGIDLSNKRIVGISSSYQEYIKKESLSYGVSVDELKRFLGI